MDMSTGFLWDSWKAPLILSAHTTHGVEGRVNGTGPGTCWNTRGVRNTEMLIQEKLNSSNVLRCTSDVRR